MSNITEEQLPQQFRAIIDAQVKLYGEARTITNQNDIPEPLYIPLDDKKHWLHIPDVICVYIDMKNSTGLCANSSENLVAKAYQLFTQTAVELLNEFGAAYIDVRGDGAFGLFDRDKPYHAIAAAITFRTFAEKDFTAVVSRDAGVEVGTHIGIDQKTLLVRRIGFRRAGGRTDRQNEVWAGKPVNMAAKLSSVSVDGEILVSDRFFAAISDDLVRLSCGCPDGTKKELWSDRDLSGDNRFDFDVAHSLKTKWCPEHGEQYCTDILALDGEPA